MSQSKQPSIRFLGLGARLFSNDALITFDEAEQKYVLRFRDLRQWGRGYLFPTLASALAFAKPIMTHRSIVWTNIKAIATG